MRKAGFIILAATLTFAVGCSKRSPEATAGSAGSAAPTAAAEGSAAGSAAAGSAEGSAAAAGSAGSDMAAAGSAGSADPAGSAAAGGSAAPGGGAEAMLHRAGMCPSTVLGATTKTALKGKSVTVTIEAADKDAIGAIQKRTDKLLAEKKTVEAGNAHDQKGTHGGSEGLCPVYVPEGATATAKHGAKGVVVTITPKDKADELAKEIDARSAKAADWVKTNVKGGDKGNQGGVGGGQGDDGSNHSGKGDSKGHERKKSGGDGKGTGGGGGAGTGGGSGGGSSDKRG